MGRVAKEKLQLLPKNELTNASAASPKKRAATYDQATKTVPEIFKDMVFVDQEKEIKDVIDVLQPAFYILEKEVVLP